MGKGIGWKERSGMVGGYGRGWWTSAGIVGVKWKRVEKEEGIGVSLYRQKLMKTK